MPHCLRVALLVSGLTLACISGAADDPALLVRDCLATIDPEVVGINPLEQRCPGIDDAVTALAFDSPLHDRWESEIDGAMLQDLLRLREPFDAPPQGSSPDPRQLADVLHAFQQQASSEPRSLWQRFKAWVERLLTPKNSTDAPQWLTGWLQGLSVPGAVRQVAFLLVVVVTIGLAVLIVYREIKAARLPGSPVNGLTSGPAGSDPQQHLEPEGSLEGMAGASVAEKPRLLLRILANELLRLGRLRTERALTHHELVRDARLDNAVERDDFRLLARVAERLLYARSEVPLADIERALAGGLQIHRQLQGRAASR